MTSEHDELSHTREPACSFRSCSICKTGILAAELARLPDVREGIVREIRMRIEAGTYRIDSRKIAERMLQEDCCLY